MLKLIFYRRENTNNTCQKDYVVNNIRKMIYLWLPLWKHTFYGTAAIMAQPIHRTVIYTRNTEKNLAHSAEPLTQHC